MRVRADHALRIASRIDASRRRAYRRRVHTCPRERKEISPRAFRIARQACVPADARRISVTCWRIPRQRNRRAYRRQKPRKRSTLSVLSYYTATRELTRDQVLFSEESIAVTSAPVSTFYFIADVSRGTTRSSKYTGSREAIRSVQLRPDEKLSVPFFGFTTIRIIFVINVPLCAIVSRLIKDGR